MKKKLKNARSIENKVKFQKESKLLQREIAAKIKLLQIFFRKKNLKSFTILRKL